MKSWVRLLDKNILVDEEIGSHWLTNTEWLSGDVVIRCTENDSVDQATLPFIIDHIDMFARKFVPREQPVVRLLDEHSSRERFEWLRTPERLNITFVLLPAHITHFLHPCDSYIKKTFQKHLRRKTEVLLKIAKTNVHFVAFKLNLAVAAHHHISNDDL